LLSPYRILALRRAHVNVALSGTNALKLLLQDYPILRRKFGRVRQLDPKPQQDMPIRRALSRFESEVVFDLRFAFRARNTIVHDAAIQIVQIDRLIQRLSWMLCVAPDALLYQFVRNPTLALSELRPTWMWRCRLHLRGPIVDELPLRGASYPRDGGGARKRFDAKTVPDPSRPYYRAAFSFSGPRRILYVPIPAPLVPAS
jgi:hypothetical protein